MKKAIITDATLRKGACGQTKHSFREKTETAKPISKMLINIIAILFAPSFCEISLIGFICFKIFAIFEYSPFLYVFCTIKYTLICEYITIAKR